MNDKAFWITWYDLPEDGRDTYFNWLNEIYIPELLKRPGILWAGHYSVLVRDHFIRMTHGASDPLLPGGKQFILMFGGEHVNVFGNPTLDALHGALPASGRELLAMRTGERTNLMVEAVRVEGVGLKQYETGMTPAPCIQLGSFNYPWQHEEELLTWFTTWRMPIMQGKLGCIRIRKLASVCGWAKHAIFYEYQSLEARNRDYLSHEDGFPEMKARSDEIVARTEHAPPGSGALAVRIWPPVPVGQA